jgi:hypothetical protein
MGGACSAHEKRSAYKIVVDKLEGKRPLGTPRRRLEDNIKIELGEVGLKSMDWIRLPGSGL